jgi:L-arabinose transport system substrate-binding protein
MKLHLLLAPMVCAVTLVSGVLSPAAEPVKIGFIVKMPEQPWFINEQNAAEAAGKKLGFNVVKIGATDGEKVITAIDNLHAQGAQGFVICTPDVRLGAVVAAKARAYNMKVLSVDDQFVDSKGKPIVAIPHLGMSGFKIGVQVGQAIAEEMTRRGWKPEEVAAIRITNYELPTAKERTDGATKALLDAGFKKENIFDAPQKTTDTESANTASSPVFAKHASFKKWIIYALNEESVLGGVRASEQFGFDASSVIGIGINGSGVAFAEFQKSHPTGFYATVAVSSTMHGKATAENLFNWISKGVVPPANTETQGTVMTRENWQKVRSDLQL